MTLTQYALNRISAACHQAGIKLWFRSRCSRNLARYSQVTEGRTKRVIHELVKQTHFCAML